MTPEERPNPLVQHRAAMKEALETGGGQAVIAYIEGFDSDPLRRVLYIASKQVLVGKRLDDLMTVADAGVAEMLRQAEYAVGEDTQGECVRGAHIISYNLAAELADCWPGDEVARTPAHHRRGIQAATDCLLWSQPAGQPMPISNDYWVRGIHQLALGDTSAAIRSWTASLEFAEEAAEAKNEPTTVGPDGTFAVILNSGYLGLAAWIDGDAAGERAYVSATEAFEAQLGDSARAEEAKVGLGQLQLTRERHGP